QRLTALLVVVLAEFRQADVTGLRIEHECRWHGRNVDFVADDGEVDQLVEAAALERNLDGRSFGTAQLSHRVVARPALGLFAFDFRDDVAAPKALLIRWRAFEERDDRDFAIDDGDRNAEAVVTPLLPLAHLGVRAGIHEARMRVERLEHAGDGTVDQAVGFDRADVIRVDRVQRGSKDLVLVRDLVFDRQGTTAVKAPNQGAKSDGEHRNRYGTITSHMVVNFKPCP